MTKKPFDENEFEERTHDEFEAFQGELQNTTDKKAEIFLQVSNFQKCLQDSMELILETKPARQISPRIIVDILHAKGVFSDQDAEDAEKINKIRNIFAHNFNEKSIKQAERIISTIDLHLAEPPGIEPGGHAHLPAVYDTLKKESKDWDVYRRLDFICFNLLIEMENNVIFLREDN